MNCHECAMSRSDRPAVGLCRFCSVALCKEHLVEAYRHPPTVPTYSCAHQPWSSAIVPREKADLGEIGEKRWLRTTA